MRAGKPDAALLSVLARHPGLPWAAALLQPGRGQLPELLGALLAPRAAGPVGMPGADAAADGAAPAELKGKSWSVHAKDLAATQHAAYKPADLPREGQCCEEAAAPGSELPRQF